METSPDSQFYFEAGHAQTNMYHAVCIFTPRAHARARGYVIGRGVYIYIYPARACASKGLCDRSWCLYINYILLSAKKISNFFLSLKILTFRRPLQHRNFLLRI